MGIELAIGMAGGMFGGIVLFLFHRIIKTQRTLVYIIFLFLFAGTGSCLLDYFFYNTGAFMRHGLLGVLMYVWGFVSIGAIGYFGLFILFPPQDENIGR